MNKKLENSRHTLKDEVFEIIDSLFELLDEDKISLDEVKSEIERVVRRLKENPLADERLVKDITTRIENLNKKYYSKINIEYSNPVENDDDKTAIEQLENKIEETNIELD